MPTYFRVLKWFLAMKTKGIGYVRVSTDKQAEHGVSLEAKVEKIRAMAIVHDVELLDVLVDAGESAKDLDRPGMVRILEMVQSRAVGMVIVAKLDRLTRSVKDLAVLLEQFQRRGVSLVSVAESLDTGSASGRLVLNIMVSVSQWEREAIGERTRDAMRHMKTKLEFVGNAPYGFRQSEEHTSELQSLRHLVCRLLLEKKKPPPTGFQKPALSPAPQNLKSAHLEL